MAVRIRLARIGKKKAPYYRIVAIDQRVKRDGKYLENLGTYNPLNGEIIQFHEERLQDWLSKGAIPSDTVLRIQRKYKKLSSEKKTEKVVEAKKAVAAKTVEKKAVKKAAPKVEKVEAEVKSGDKE